MRADTIGVSVTFGERCKHVTSWYARPVLHVADVQASVDFYRDKLGFTETWRHAEDNELLIAQVDRDGCAIILSCQWP